MTDKLVAFQFEVFGKVQRVFMRDFTCRTANELGVGGRVVNTPQNTVSGVAIGASGPINEFKHWLQFTGSPKSRIERAEFKDISDEQTIAQLAQQHPSFAIDKSYGHAPKTTSVRTCQGQGNRSKTGGKAPRKQYLTKT